ncbi:MAG: hypothetical protein LBP67_05550 [Bacteroidales bacterium]|jgi:hypothetical protein|nr:hypothetical protein [Bacteroidales bacterium]
MQKNEKLFIIVIILIILTSCNKKPINDVIIAHAGGAIDGYLYTNSLEAMNLSYEKGCRLFELDLLLTSDNKLVAAHTWSDFKNFTGYPEINDTPLTEEEFMSRKIYGKYTPMNMDMINKWFKTHNDAILITDKINKPALLYKYFDYKDRLIMELFSWQAIDTAIEIGIEPMISSWLMKPDTDIEKIFSDKNIKYFAVSRTYLLKNRDLLKKLKEQKIKTYMFFSYMEYDEKYFLDNEMDYIYGIYADDMDIMEYFN